MGEKSSVSTAFPEQTDDFWREWLASPVQIGLTAESGADQFVLHFAVVCVFTNNCRGW